MTQEKNSFDSKTIMKIGKGSLYAGGSAGIVYLLMLSGMEITEASGLATSIIMAMIGVVKGLKGKDIKKTFAGFGFAIGSAVVVSMLEMIPELDFGTLTPVITALSAIILNSVKEYINGVEKNYEF